MDAHICKLFSQLSTRGRVMIEYVWLTPNCGTDLRSITRIVDEKPQTLADVPIWTYDGSTTGQESASCPVIYLKPRSMHADPLRSASETHGMLRHILC